MKKIFLLPCIFAVLYSTSSFANIRYVKPTASGTGNGSSWVNASANLQAIINASGSNDQIWVAAGTYLPTQDPFGSTTPTDPRDRTFYLKDSVKIYGGFAGTETALNQRNWVTNSTILSGDFNNDDAGFTNNSENAYHVVLSVRDSSATVVDGFTIKGGNANDFFSDITVETSIIRTENGGGLYNDHSNPSLSNIVISNNSVFTDGGGMYNTNSNPRLSKIVFAGNKAALGAGMWNGNSNPILINVIFSGNTATARGGGMYNNSSNLILSNVTLTDNAAAFDGAAMLNNSSDLTLTNIILWGNTGGGTQGISNTFSTVVINNSDVQGIVPIGTNISSFPLFTNDNSPAGADGIWFTQDDGLQLQCGSPGSPCINSGTTTDAPLIDILGVSRLSGGTPDIGAYEQIGLITVPATSTILYVKKDAAGNGSSWANAMGEVGDALNSVYNSPDNTITQIWVAAGNYIPKFDPSFSPCPNDGRDRSFYLKNELKLYGGFAGTETLLTQRNWITNSTILSGDFNGDDIGFNNNEENAYHVVLSVKDSSNTVLDGFTIKAGNAFGNGNATVEGIINISRVEGGGIYNYTSNPSLKNLTISDNTAVYYGGGIQNYYYSSPSLNNVNIIGNVVGSRGGGISIGNFSSPTLNNVNISNNTSNFGGGIFNIGADPVFNNVTISSNTSIFGGGMYNIGSNLILNNVIISNNSANKDGGGGIDNNGGGMYNEISNPSLNNVLIIGNSANNVGGGIINFFSNPSLNNVTISGNSATNNGGGIVNYSNPISTAPSNPILKNTIVWGNTGGGTKGIYSDGGCTPIITYSNIQDSLYTGTGNISAAPLFTNPAVPAGADGIMLTADDGLQLTCASPCINTGTNTGTPALDILGNAIFGITKDIGAYESQSGSSPVLATNYQTTIQNINNNVLTATGCILIAKVTPNGNAPATGNVTAKVWIDATQNNQFVKRHYEITPANNAATATARLTIYFTQAEFNNFNAVNAIKLPTNGTDAIGKANLLVEKRSGTGDVNGLFSSYTGAVTNINPADEDIVWNASSSRWEISFNVTGFSGFWVKTQASVLPLKLLSFTGKRDDSNNQLNWVTTSEINTNRFEIAYSTNGVNFSVIGNVNAKGNSQINNYQFSHNISNSIVFYRLKMIDNDGKFEYSNIINLKGEDEKIKITVYPNPATDYLNIKVNNEYKNSTVQLFSIDGKLLQTINIKNNLEYINIKPLAKGIYTLRFYDGIVIKWMKE
jgi:hypothetical protein